MGERRFQAGAAKLDITPALGGSLAGHMSDRVAGHVHDPLHVRAMVLDNGERTLAMAVCDLVAIGASQVDQARHLIHGHTGIPLGDILIAATHTHSAATPAPLFQSDPDSKYLEWLVTRMGDAVRCAHVNLRPARIGWGSGRESRVVFNRRFYMKPGKVPPGPFETTTDQVKMNPGYENPDTDRPAGPIDPEIPLLSIQHVDGAPMAVLANFALHYVGGDPGTEISADYFAMWADALSRKLGACSGDENAARPAFLGILSNGCSGDINNIDVRTKLVQPYPYHQMRHVAELVAGSTHAALQNIEYHDWAPLGAKESMLELKVRKPDARERARAREILSKAGPQLKTLPEIYARETLLLSEWPDVRQTRVQALRIGDLGIVTFPGEAFVEMGLEIKKSSPFKTTLCIELANDYAGYIPTSKGHEQGGYETWRARSSFLEVAAAERMVAAAQQLLQELAGQG